MQASDADVRAADLSLFAGVRPMTECTTCAQDSLVTSVLALDEQEFAPEAAWFVELSQRAAALQQVPAHIPPGG